MIDVAKTVRPHNCRECGKAISDAEALLAGMRANGTSQSFADPAWCYECADKRVQDDAAKGGK